MTAPVVLRPRAAITAELDALWPAAGDGSPFHQEARDALRRMLAGGPGPLTGARTDPPLPLRAIVAELAAAEALPDCGRSADRDYAAGLEHAVMWAESATPARHRPTCRTLRAAGRGRSRRPVRTAVDIIPAAAPLYPRAAQRSRELRA